MVERKINVLDMFHGDNREAIPNFPALAQADIYGVIHKASQGMHYKDPRYDERRAACARSNILWGAYHFLDSSGAEAQADWFLTCSGFSSGDPILLACDYETHPQGQTAALHQLITFMKAVDSVSPSSCVLYSGNLIRENLTPPRGGAASSDMTGSMQFFQMHRLWLAEYGPTERVPWPWNTPVKGNPGENGYIGPPGVFLWQFTETARINPVVGNLDGNFFDGYAADLKQRWIK